jgi:hypothetical protein
VLPNGSDVLGRRAKADMFKLFLISIVIVPVLLGMYAATRPSQRRGPALLIALVAGYDVLYFLLLHYLRVRWV